MEIMLAFILGAAVGAASHAVMPHRATRGAVLGPVLGAVGAGTTWMALTWAGMSVENPLLWVAAIAAAFAVTLPAVAILARERLAHDRRERARLRIG